MILQLLSALYWLQVGQDAFLPLPLLKLVVEEFKIIFFAPTYEQKYALQVTKVPELSTVV